MPAFLYGTLSYLLFLASFTYAVLFMGNLLVPRMLDGPASMPAGQALLIDLGLLLLFGVQHSVMARKGFKAWWAKIVPPVIERSTYVLLANVVLFALCWFWQPIEGDVWLLTDPAAVTATWAVFWLGWGVLFLSSCLINHFELFGLRQVWAHMMGSRIPSGEFRTPFLYKHVRHPLYLGFLLGMWAAPQMSLGHLVFAAGSTAYILVGIWFEERDLVATFGERYRAYRAKTPMLLPRIARSRGEPAK